MFKANVPICFVTSLGGSLMMLSVNGLTWSLSAGCSRCCPVLPGAAGARPRGLAADVGLTGMGKMFAKCAHTFAHCATGHCTLAHLHTFAASHCTLLHLSKLNIFAKNRFEKSAFFLKFQQKQIANFAQISKH